MRKSAILMTASVLLLGAVSCSEKKADEPVKKEISVQLYSIRSVIGNPELYAQNHEEAFKALAEMGYTSVATQTGNSMESIRSSTRPTLRQPDSNPFPHT